MKILQMVDVPWDSGLAHYALTLSQGLQKEGHDVFISAVPGEKPWLKAQRLGLQTVPWATLKGLKALRGFLKDHAIDLVNAHTGSTHSLAVAAALGRKVAIVRTRSDARGVQRRVGSAFLFSHTQRLIAAADYIRRACVEVLRLPPRKALTVYQGIAVEDFEVRAAPAEPLLGIVARLDPVKGHRYLLEAFSLLQDAYPRLRARVMGREENIKQRELRAMAERLGLEGRVEFAGFESQVPQAMARCAVGVIASTGSEAVSRVALEWMAAGRPLVATRVGCLPEIVEDGKTGFLVEPKDAPAMASALARLLRDPSQAQAMGEAARARVEALFSLPRFARQTLLVYEQARRELLRA